MNFIKTKEILTALNLVEDYLKDKKYNKAISELENILKLDSNNIDALMYLGEIYFNLKEYYMAKINFEKILVLDNNDISSHLYLGRIYLNLMNYEKALLEFKEVLSLDKNNLDAIFYLSGAYFNLENYTETIINLKRFLELDKDNIEAFLFLGNSYLLNNDIKNSKVIYEKILKLDETNIQAKYNLASIYVTSEEYDKAIVKYNEILQINRKHIDSILNLGKLYFMKNNYNKSIDEFKKVLELDYYNIDALNYLGKIYFNFKKYDDALNVFLKVLKVDANNIETLLFIGFIYTKKEELDLAIEKFKNILEIEENDIACLALNSIYYEIEDLVKADEYFLRGTDLNFYKYIKENFNSEEIQGVFRLFTSVISFRNLNLSFNIEENSECRIGHYTKTYILPNLFPPKDELGKLRLNSIAYMNDPTEGEIFLELLSKISFHEKNYSNDDIMATRKFINNIYSNEKDINRINSENKIFLTSFTTSIDNSLPMWVQYGDFGQGCCIVFENNFFDDDDNTSLTIDNDLDKEYKYNNNKYCLYSIRYINLKNEHDFENSSEDLREIFSALIDLRNIYEAYETDDLKNKLKNIIQNILNQIRFLFKDKNYEHENELRVIKFEHNPENILFDSNNFSIPHIYINIEKQLKVNEIILGPKVQNSIEIATYLYSRNIKKVSKSQIKFQ